MKHSFGVFDYPWQGNIGDDIQSIAAANLLPQVDYYIDRDNVVADSADKPPGLLVANGWFIKGCDQFPPPAHIKPFYIAVHVFNNCMAEDPILSHLKQHTVGCRDDYTLDLLSSRGVNCYFSGCVTMTLENDAPTRTDEVILCDVPKWVKVPDGLNTTSVTHIHKIEGRENRYAHAHHLLNLYKRAKLVVTSRLHCAMPCIAFKTPVIFVDRSGTAYNDRRLALLGKYIPMYGKQDEINWSPVVPDITMQANFIRTKMRQAVDEYLES